jgi:hypothetical protein
MTPPMRLQTFPAIVAAVLAVVPSWTAQAGLPPTQPLPLPGAEDTLPAGELSAVLEAVARTAFDTPQSWAAELRARRVTIGGRAYLVVRGTDLLCGGTGACQTWLFARRDGRWADLMADEAPIADGLFVVTHLSHGLHDLVASAPISAGRSRYEVLAFDGRAYRRTRCYEAGVTDRGGPAPDARGAPCGGRLR